MSAHTLNLPHPVRGPPLTTEPSGELNGNADVCPTAGIRK